MTIPVDQLGYLVAAFMFLGLAFLLMTRLRDHAQNKLLAAIALACATWAGILSSDAIMQRLGNLSVVLLEFGFDALWIVYLAVLMRGATDERRLVWLRFGGPALVAGLVVIAAGLEVTSQLGLQGRSALDILIVGSILTSLFVLVSLEQVYRNTRVSQRDGIALFCLAIGGIFAFDLYMYSYAVVDYSVSEVAWGTRGLVVAICVPVLGLAVARSKAWSVGIFVSRKVVFYSTTTLAAGIYLAIIGLAGQLVKTYGGAWGERIQLALLFGAFIVLMMFVLSARNRARLRVLVAKHFFEHKYDYKAEWQRLVETMSSSNDPLPLRKRAVKALCQIVTGSSGQLWMRSTDEESYVCTTSWNEAGEEEPYAADDPLPAFLARSGWVLDTRAAGILATECSDASVKVAQIHASGRRLIVPLFDQNVMIGFTYIAVADDFQDLNFEDYDFLKLAGRQLASYLMQDIASEQLSESRQFEAFNKLTSFLMHDLKNTTAQLTLVARNATKHRDNPRFVDDAMETIKGAAARMTRVLGHLQSRSIPDSLEKVELGKVLLEAVSSCEDRTPVPRISLEDSQLHVRGNRDRLLMAVCHAIRNAQDATGADGSIDVIMRSSGQEYEVLIRDTGSGMSSEFIKERLFRPFDSTKGTQGMGIGAYQVRETMKAFGGAMHVESEVGQGTEITLRFRPF